MHKVPSTLRDAVGQSAHRELLIRRPELAVAPHEAGTPAALRVEQPVEENTTEIGWLFTHRKSSTPRQ